MSFNSISIISMLTRGRSASLHAELAAFYNGYIRGESVELPGLPFQYADYAFWQRRRLEAGMLEEQLDILAPETRRNPVDCTYQRTGRGPRCRATGAAWRSGYSRRLVRSAEAARQAAWRHPVHDIAGGFSNAFVPVHGSDGYSGRCPRRRSRPPSNRTDHWRIRKHTRHAGRSFRHADICRATATNSPVALEAFPIKMYPTQGSWQSSNPKGTQVEPRWRRSC